MRRLARRARRLGRAGALLAALAVGAAPAAGQDRPARRDSVAGRDTARAGRRTAADTGADTTRRRRDEELVEWAEADSVMRGLFEREGYTVTRYQGEVVTFRATERGLQLEGGAAVERERTVLVGDTVIYDDRRKVIQALGDTVILRDPTQTDDLVAVGRIAYNVERREGTVSQLATTFENEGNNWYIAVEGPSVVRTDTSDQQRNRLYAHDASFTSCELTEPHYHFRTGEIKVVSKRLLVARPAVLYIADIPVAWLPFVFQDMRSGRRSGILTPRFGLSDIVRNSPTYRRNVDNLGYYFALNDYMDASLWLDWRSGARPRLGDPGFVHYHGEWNYRWINRFLSGSLAVSDQELNDDRRNLALSWNHRQDFSAERKFSTNFNYVSNTRVQLQQNLNPLQTLATIRSTANYQDAIGPFSFNVGGTRTQYPGRDQIEQDFPNISVPSKPLNLTSWLVWTPQLSLNNRQTLHMDQGAPIPFRFTDAGGGVADSVRVDANRRTSSLSFDTPLRIFEFTWRNSFRVTDQENDYPEQFTVFGSVADTTNRRSVVYNRSFSTVADWTTAIDLPQLFQGTWNLVPSVSIDNVDPTGFWVRSHFTGGRWVHQDKRLRYGVSATPTLFGLFPGFGPVSRFRHSLSPSVSYSYAPAADVPDEYLRALNLNRQNYVGAIAQNQITVGLNTNLEAKLRSATDTNPDAAKKVRVLSVNFSSVSYNFERARQTGTGWETDRFDMRFASELLPGFNFDIAYDLFQGDLRSDTAVFDPYRESIHTSFSLNGRSRIFSAVARLFGRRAEPAPAPESEAQPVAEDSPFQRAASAATVAGSRPRAAQFAVPTGQGWQATFNYTYERRRPPVGGNVLAVDPRALCQDLESIPVLFDQCVLQKTLAGPGGVDLGTSPLAGGTTIVTPPTQALQGNINFNFTPNWSAQWGTTYDFEAKGFASHIVSLQRELHDWRAIFAFTQSPNGNFSFNFFISLKAEPDLKFDYNRNTIRRQQ
ncbi:MAG TPA: putative LPS assembly protein LptD [Gemmatimonadaceae bacterium]|nr:putative LPS assembly protein LptD [Gemmatimonadaceae bacterium]